MGGMHAAMIEIPCSTLEFINHCGSLWLSDASRKVLTQPISKVVPYYLHVRQRLRMIRLEDYLQVMSVLA